jgi:hypothetical protein
MDLVILNARYFLGLRHAWMIHAAEAAVYCDS